ncbi:chromosome partitioning protein ParA [Corallococcus sp. RDP092CA]|uniref:chromosome partitioning protein ParA n=1 Tax=Corallococcus sp. RDP092CA TaxID=3109369 RepID=UPI0035AFBEBD
MALFATMSEDEIRKREAQLDERQHELERRHAELARRDEGVKQDEERIRTLQSVLDRDRATFQDDVVAKQRELAEAEQALALREAQARAGFVEQQRAAFREVFEARTRELDAREAALDAEEARQVRALEGRRATVAEQEEALARRESEARERHRLLEQRAAALAVRETQVAQAEAERDSGFAERRRAFEQELQAQGAVHEARAEALRAREAQVALAEQARDAGFTEARRRVDLELHERRQQAEQALAQLHEQRVTAMQQELAEQRRRRTEALEHELDAQRARADARLVSERTAFEAARDQTLASLGEAEARAGKRVAELAAKERELGQRQQLLDAREGELETRRKKLDEEVRQLVAHRQRALDAAETALEERREQLEEEVEKAVATRRGSFEQREATLKADLSRVQGQLQSADRLIGQFESLKRQLGGRDAELVLADLKAYQEQLSTLREELAQQPLAMREEFERIRLERDRLQALSGQQSQDLEDLKARMRGEDALRRELLDAQSQTQWLTTQKDSLQGRCDQLVEDNKRLRAAYNREEDRAARIRDIETVDLTELARRPPEQPVNEKEWLEGIDARCKEYGLHFNPRILKAFHTSLKTAEWAPLTVLAGVSGTGKSELPRLYAHFGGLTFMSLPVQPNWDSQEAMLGFFNSIDNRFDAQPVLQLLARSQKPWDETNHGLRDSLVLILLDEMNLAHAELYFAEFLSKLESRRGTKGDPPKLEVKLGSGMERYNLPLGRNVLWTGTMNQDETTKSLSDKVLDRSIVIHFPRPVRLERRLELKPLPAPAPLLHRKTWESWWSRSSGFTDEQIAPFKRMIEDINDAMSTVGRALGHRVWQSVEYYMANYPDTREAQRTGDAQALRLAMRTAFEDQLAQKVMPKLRGIETRGRSKTGCLDKIRTLLINEAYGIVQDFNTSLESGYGQFIWQTASFLQEAPPEVAGRTGATAGDSVEASVAAAPVSVPAQSTAAPRAQELGAKPAEDHPPEKFLPGKPDRVEKWRQLNPDKRQKYLRAQNGTPQ